MTRRHESLAVSCGCVAVTATALLESGGPLWLAAIASIALIGVWGCLR